MGGSGRSSGGHSTGPGAQSKSLGQSTRNEKRVLENIESSAATLPMCSTYVEKSPGSRACFESPGFDAVRTKSGRPSVSVVHALNATSTVGIRSPPVIDSVMLGGDGT